MEETALVLDTHTDIQELIKFGMSEPLAETVVRQRVRLIEYNFATKADIEKLREETRADIATTNANIALSKNDMIKWFIGVNLGVAALLVAAIKLL